MNRYDIDLDLTNRNSLSVLLKHIKKNSTVLEFGPANGRLTRYLKNELGCSVYAVEIDEEAASHLGQYCEVLVVGDIESYAWMERFKDIKFDTIVFADVLEHLYSPDKVLIASKEFLKEDGNILVSLPNIAHNAIVMELLRDKFTYSKTGLLDNTHIRFFTNSSFLELAKRCGLHCSYESGIYARADETEFGYAYENFEMGHSLEQREFGEVYQFVYELKKNPLDERVSEFGDMYKREKILGIAKLYVDVGEGFSEENSIEIKNPQTKESLEFDVSGFRGIKNLRFDPFDKTVSVKADAILATFEDKTTQKIEPHNNNSCYVNLDVEYFVTDDSHYLYTIDEEMQGGIEKIVIGCEYKLTGKEVCNEVVRLFSLESKTSNEAIRLLSLELSEMKNSRGWKFILFVRKLKRFFNA
ncbi:MAG: class I SAM-dependent methyltransferase [Sulfurimonas sp.]|uniref:class I SAM-dependent methyltransferase n=1 Tax=Sulfurimonas sp. TaxID=2022749 RepID=UPI00260ED370|nr:class I SAM-dependent methyltransferase [Sulfurimonas sp.]MDD5373385.1 class I SAM-dependent methyltransferase [Sulfurimonas sp.]